MNRVAPFYKRDQRYAAACAAVESGEINKAEVRLDSTDPQPATSEMLCGFVLGCVCSAAVLIVWNWKV